MPVAVLLVGVAAGVGGILLTLLLHLVQHLLYGYTEATFLIGVERASRLRRVVAVSAGGVVVGAGWWLHRRYVDGDALSVARTLRDRTARLPVVHTVIDAVLQIVAVGVGGSLGREGAPRQTGAALASWLGERLAVTASQRRTLVACGAGAGLAAVYNVPLAGAIFALELLLASLALRHVVPALLTSLIATAVAWPVLSTHPTYVVGSAAFSWPVLCWALVAGPVLGLLALTFTRLMEWSRTHAPSGALAAVAIPAGFALLGAMATWRPELLGNGKGPAEIAFTGSVGLDLAAVLAVLKPIATALCLRTGAIGGLLTPSFATGAMLGLAGGLLWGRLWSGGSSLDYAMVGAAAFLAVTQRAALTAVVLTLELTRTDVSALPPMLLAVVLAVLVARVAGESTGWSRGG